MQKEGSRLFAVVRRWKHMQGVSRMGMLPRNESSVMRAIAEAQSKGEPCGSGKVAATLGVSTPAISRTLRHLRTKGWITSTTTKEDRRAIHLELTPEGYAQLAHNEVVADEFVSGVYRGMGAENFDRFCELFEMACDAAEKKIADFESSKAEKEK